MRQFVANVAALTVDMVRVVMDDRGLMTAWNDHGRESGIVLRIKKRGFGRNFAELEQRDVVVSADIGGVDSVDFVQTHLGTDTQRNAICFGFESPPERQSRPLQLVVGRDDYVLDQFCIRLAQVRVSSEQRGYLGNRFGFPLGRTAYERFSLEV